MFFLVFWIFVGLSGYVLCCLVWVHLLTVSFLSVPPLVFALPLYSVSRISKEKAELTASLSSSSSIVAELRSKGAAYDIIHQRATTLEREIETTRHRAELVQTSLDQMILERDTASSQTLELKQKCQVLAVDKSYLTKEIDASSTRCTHLEDAVSSLREEKRALVEVKQQYHEELLQEKDEARRGYEDRLSLEINKLQKETALELSQIRNAQKQVHVTEVASLTERLASTQDANQASMVELNELRQTHGKWDTPFLVRATRSTLGVVWVCIDFVSYVETLGCSWWMGGGFSLLLLLLLLLCCLFFVFTLLLFPFFFLLFFLLL